MITLRQYVKRGNITTVEKTERYEGVWWAPNRPDSKVSGTLHVTPNNGIVLLLNGTLREGSDPINEPPSSHDIVLGVQPSGFKFTLQDCKEDRYQTPFGDGYPTQRIVAGTAYAGIHADETSDLTFSKFSVELTHLSNWMRNVRIGSPERRGDGYFVPYDSEKCSTTSELHVSLDGVDVLFQSKPGYSRTRNRKERVKLFVDEWMEVCPHHPVGISEVTQQVLEPIRDFLSLMTVRPNSITRLDVVVSVEHAGKVYDERIRVHTTSQYERAADVNLFNKSVVLFFASNVASNPERYLRRWMSLERDMRDVCELFFGVHYNHGPFNTNRFLNVAQALESFSRVRYNPPKGERCFRKRLKDITERASPLVDEIVLDTAEFAAWVVDTRNYLTHLDASNKKRIARDDDLDLLTYALLWVLRVMLLLETGFSAAQCREALERSNEFGGLKQAVRQRAVWRTPLHSAP